MNAPQIQRARQVAAFVAIIIAACLLVLILDDGGSEGDDTSSPKPQTRTVVVQAEAKFDTQSATVLALPVGYRAVAVKCDGFGHRVYVTRGRNPRIAVFADKECR